MTETLKLLYGVFKLRIGFSIMLCALAGIAISPGPYPGPWVTFLLALGVLLSSASAGAFNQFMERDLDAQMRRTCRRPFVTGRLAASGSWLTVIVLLTIVPAIVVALSVNVAAALYMFLGAFVYGVVYTVWLKRRTAWNIVIGGLAGTFAVLAGAAAVNPDLAPGPLLLSAVLFLWTPPHFWSLAIACRQDYALARVPMLPIVVGDRRAAQAILAHTVALVLLSLAPALVGAGPVYVAFALAGGLPFVRTSIALVRDPGPQLAMKNFRASLVQLGLLLIGTLLDAAW